MRSQSKTTHKKYTAPIAATQIEFRVKNNTHLNNAHNFKQCISIKDALFKPTRL